MRSDKRSRKSDRDVEALYRAIECWRIKQPVRISHEYAAVV